MSLTDSTLLAPQQDDANDVEMLVDMATEDITPLLLDEDVDLINGSRPRRRSSFSESQSEYSVEDAVDKMGFGLFQLKILAIGGLFTATDALEMMLLSVLSPVLRCEWMLGEWQVAMVTTVVFIGMFAGSTLWGKFSDKYGRLKTVNLGAIWILYYGCLTAFSPNLHWLLILRCLVGFGFGGAVQSFTLISEYLPTKNRAKILILCSFSWSLGSMFEVLMAYLLLPQWRLLVASSALPIITAVFLLFFMPESARYLVAADQVTKAEKILAKGAKMNNTTLPDGSLMSNVQVSRGRFLDLLSKYYWLTTLILWLLWFSCAFSYYGMVLLGSELLETRQAIPINFALVDLIGRRKTLGVCFSGASVFFLLLLLVPRDHVVLVTAAMFGARAFTNGIFNIVYIYTAEVYPTSVRSVGLGTCSAMARIGAMVSPFVAQVLRNRVSTIAAGLIYTTFCATSAVCCLLLPIETKDREMPQSVHQNPLPKTSYNRR